MKKNQEEMNIADNPLYHDTWKLLKKYRDVVWSLELSVQQVRSHRMLKLLDTSIDLLRTKHKNGENYYWLLYYSFLSPQQLRNVEEIIEKLRPHIRDISFRTYYRRRREAIDALSSILWGYTSKDSIEILEKFFPDDKEAREEK